MLAAQQADGDAAAPPASIWYALPVNGLPGSDSFDAEKEPSDQSTDATSTSSTPESCTAPPMPGRVSTASPAKPSSTPPRVRSGGRSPVAVRSTTSHIGTAAMSSAARPDGTSVSASTTRPLPPRISSRPTMTAEPTWARVARSAAGPYRQATRPSSSRPAAMKRAPAERNGGMVRTTTRMAR